MNTDLKKIKDKYGEKMMQLCRDLFSTLLEQEGLLFYLMESHFEFSKFLYDDIIDNRIVDQFKNYIYSLVDVEKKEIIINKTPKELLKEAGYNLYECKTEEEIQYFKKYYRRGEELCTFNGGRLDRCYVFFAVKENVDEIKREDFNNPKRQDDYGVSVISIQFSKGNINTLSIKNRYNHTVNNPDATFSNNLDNIIPGLTNSFARVYGFNINQNSNGFEIEGYICASDGRYYKYNYEITNIYYCPNNIIIDNFEVIKDYQKKERYIIFDYFILDLKNKKIILYDDYIDDSFVYGLKNINNIEVIKIKENGNKKIYINNKNIEIEIDKVNRIISYSNKDIITINDNFLDYNESLVRINLPEVKEIGNCFLSSNEVLTSINLPKVQKIGYEFLYLNKSLKSINLPKVQKIGNCFLSFNEFLIYVNLPEVKEIGNSFLHSDKALTYINLPKVKQIGYSFLWNNKSLIYVNMPKIRKVDNKYIQKLLNSKHNIKVLKLRIKEILKLR